MTRWMQDIALRFWGHVDKGEPDECWPWKRAHTAKGYGLVRICGKLMRAHRVAWALHAQVAPTTLTADIEVHHTCETNDCCNPAHLEAIDSQTHDRIHATDMRRRIR